MTSLDRSKAGEEKAYEAALGGIVKRTFAAIKEVHIGEAGQTGPLAQNGGEVVMEAGECRSLRRCAGDRRGPGERAGSLEIEAERTE